MFLYLVLIFLHFAAGEVKRTEETKRMIGVDTVHEVKIDKDTIISQNLKPDKRGKEKNGYYLSTIEEEEPDWSYSAFPADLEIYVQEFKQNMSECLKEVQANDKRPVKRLSPKTESPVHGECLIACVLKRNKIIDNGKINKGNLISLVSKFYSKDTKMMKKLDKNLDRCVEISAGVRDECQLAARLNDCTNDLMASNKHKITVNYNGDTENERATSEISSELHRLPPLVCAGLASGSPSRHQDVQQNISTMISRNISIGISEEESSSRRDKLRSRHFQHVSSRIRIAEFDVMELT